jgi:hypothetical protein
VNKSPAAPKRCVNTARGLDQTANQGAIRPAMKDIAAPPTKRAPAAKRDSVERLTYTAVITVITAVPALAFAFSFGNVGLHGVSLGVDARIAYLTGPAVDLSVVGLIVAASFLSHRGRTERELWPVHLMSVLCAAAMLYLNCGQAVYEHRWRLAVFDAVGPLLLVGWGSIGPWLLRQLASATAGAPAHRTASTPAARTAPQGERTAADPERTAPPTSPQSAPAAPRTDAPAAPDRTGVAAERTPRLTPERAHRVSRLEPHPERVRIIRQLIKDNGGVDNVTGRMVGDALGVDKSNGTRALQRYKREQGTPAQDGAPSEREDEPETAGASS